VSDVVSGFVAAGQVCLEGRAAGQVANIAGGVRASVNEVLAEIARLAGHPLRLRTLPAQPGDVRDTWADTTLAQALLGFRPIVGLAEGLARQWATFTD